MRGVFTMGLLLLLLGVLAVILGSPTDAIFGGILIGSGTIFMAISPQTRRR